MMVANVVADERTNSVLVSGEPNSRQRIIAMINSSTANRRYRATPKLSTPKYAKAADLVGGVNRHQQHPAERQA